MDILPLLMEEGQNVQKFYRASALPLLETFCPSILLRGKMSQGAECLEIVNEAMVHVGPVMYTVKLWSPYVDATFNSNTQNCTIVLK